MDGILVFFFDLEIIFVNLWKPNSVLKIARLDDLILFKAVVINYFYIKNKTNDCVMLK